MKSCYGYSDYLTRLTSPQMRTMFTKLRLNERLIKNTRSLGDANFKCPMCTTNNIETVEHFLLVCPYYEVHRDHLFRKIISKSYKFDILSSCDKIRVILNLQFQLVCMNKDNEDVVISAIVSFIKIITNLRNTPPDLS